MTENENSPENLRKFLESDDPAMVRMGISMAKGTGVPDDLLGEILWMYMLHDDKTIRAAAKSTFTYLAPNKLKEIIKNNWKASYRKLKGERFAEAIGPLVQASNSQKRLDIVLDVAIDSAWRIIESSVKAAQVKPRNKKTAKEKTSAVKALGHFGTTRAIEPLIKALMHNEPWWAKDRSDPQLGWRIHSAIFLGNIGKSEAVKPLTSILTESPEHSEANWYNIEGGLLHHRNLIEAAAEALGKIGDTRAVESLILALSECITHDIDFKAYYSVPRGGIETVKYGSSAAAKALGMIGDTRAVEPLIKALEDEDEGVRRNAKESLKKLGHEVE